MSKENRARTIGELEALKEAALNANPNLSERDMMAAVANGITDPKRLAGMTPYHEMIDSSTNYGIGEVPYHDADGVVVVEITRKGR